MTNIIVPLIISTNVFTNWTGLNYKGNELGFKTLEINHHIIYEDKKLLVYRHSEEGDCVVWRPVSSFYYIGPTNIYLGSNIPGIIYTPNFK